MPEPEQGWVDGIIPPARRYRVGYRYVGHFTGGLYDDSESCFAANAVCRRIYARYPLDEPAFHYRPIREEQEVGE